MSIVNFIDKNDITDTLRESLLSAANAALYGFNAIGKKALTDNLYPSGVTRFRNWGKLKNKRLTSPSGMVLRHMDIENFDPYTFTMNTGYEDNFLFGDHLIINDPIQLYEYDPDDNENVTSDILASFFHTMCLKDIPMAYGYLSLLQVYIGLIVDVQDDMTDPERTELILNSFSLND